MYRSSIMIERNFELQNSEMLHHEIFSDVIVNIFSKKRILGKKSREKIYLIFSRGSFPFQGFPEMFQGVNFIPGVF